MMRRIFSLCYELNVSEFFDEQPLFDNLLKLEDANGQTVLYHAIRSGDKDCVQAVLSHNISPISKFQAHTVQRSTCVCVSISDSELATSSRARDCLCQQSRNMFPFLIMSLDLHPIVRMCSKEQAVSSQVSCLPSPTLSCSDALGEYRILDLDMYHYSADDSKRMWHRCVKNIEFFSNSENVSTIQGHIFTQMSVNPLHQNTNRKRRCFWEMHSSFVCARDFFSKESIAASDGISYLIQKLMHFSFLFFSDGATANVNLQDVHEIADKSSEILKKQLQTDKPFFAVSGDELDGTSSLLFTLANSLFNCCVALKMSHSTKVGRKRFVQSIFCSFCLTFIFCSCSLVHVVHGVKSSSV